MRALSVPTGNGNNPGADDDERSQRFFHYPLVVRILHDCSRRGGDRGAGSGRNDGFRHHRCFDRICCGLHDVRRPGQGAAHEPHRILHIAARRLDRAAGGRRHPFRDIDRSHAARWLSGSGIGTDNHRIDGFYPTRRGIQGACFLAFAASVDRRPSDTLVAGSDHRAVRRRRHAAKPDFSDERRIGQRRYEFGPCGFGHRAPLRISDLPVRCRAARLRALPV